MIDMIMPKHVEYKKIVVEKYLVAKTKFIGKNIK